jgi:hypothetical protein
VKAINKLMETLGASYIDYKFIVFAEKEDNDLIDDYISVFKESFSNNISFTKFYDIHNNLTNYEELCYMSSCNHFIISNSTYSWFGAYLSNNSTKIVICPKDWFGLNLINSNNTKDLYLNEWIVM